MITTTDDGGYRVSCLDVDCPRPLMRTVATMSHAQNLERKHDRENHAEGSQADILELADLLRDACEYGDEFNPEALATAVLAAGYVKAPF